MFFTLLAAQAATPSRGRDRALVIESLEKRELLAAAGLVEIGQQPSGALDDKIVYVHGGHGYTATGSSWGYQRPLLLDMVEDLGNQDQMTYLVDYLWNAGATVVPLRPVGHQPNEVVLDNDDVEVTFTGAWSNSSSSIYFGSAGDVPYRFATTSTTETATAQYRPNISEEGFYPVYAWTRSGSDRAEDHLYRVHHSGGATEVTINHRRVGNGLVYLGTFHFEAGNAGYVEISNQSATAGNVVIADMIRFGNGMGDINRGGGVSGETRENEAGLYWVEWHVSRSQGIPTSEYRTSSSDSSATVSLSPRYAEYMNREQDGSLSDRVFVSFHSNASTGNPATATSRGVVGLHNTANGGATPNQLFLAQTLAQQVNNDLVAQNGQFEHNWQNRTSLTFQTTFNYGEINNSVINNEFDATIVETGFHDNTLDAQMLRDPRVRDAIARATYQGIVDYFVQVDGGATANIDAPPKVASLNAESTAPGEVTLKWVATPANAYSGGTPTGYTIYASTNGYGFDGGTFVAGGALNTHTLTGLDPAQTYYFKIVANNAGGQSVGSEVVAAKPSADTAKILIVNGFDRLERSLVPKESFTGSATLTADRVRPRFANSMDYAVQIGDALAAAGARAAVSTASNEGLQSGAVALAEYDAVFWIAGEESTADETFNALEQNLMTAYLAQGGKLFVSGSEIGWDLEAQNGGAAFFNNTLRADYVADDANTYSASGTPGSIFEGLALQFDNGERFYDVTFPDVIVPTAGSGAITAMNYGGGAGAAIQYDGGAAGERVVLLGFPFETITDDSIRTQAIARVLDFFDIDSTPPIIVTRRTEILLNNDDGAPTFTTNGVWLNTGAFSLDLLTEVYELAGSDNARANWQTTLPEAGRVEVFVIYTANAQNATSVNYDITTPSGTFTANVNQQTQSRTWVSLGSENTSAGPITISLDADQSSPNIDRVVADAVRIFLDVDVVATGDFNNDGSVDIADYTVWRDSLGANVVAGEAGDADFDGVVTQADYDIWVATFGQSVPVASSAARSFLAASAGLTIVEGFEADELQPVVKSVDAAFALSVASSDSAASGDVPRARSLGSPAERGAARRLDLLLAARSAQRGETDRLVSFERDSDRQDAGEQTQREEAFAGWQRFGRRVGSS
ncbi:AmiA-like protein [Botrimarina hoheduenensis]|uniref:AmiA-like protein n=2 Tax=Botrimarina hoheduenensis TaxID=2528000 RepID=A0A5C5WD37_9BACT|nr:AmiA-like protein [Botrimarina hoheduenensis]